MHTHELITGRNSGTGKSYTARQRILAEVDTPNLQTWVIDGNGADLLDIADKVTRYGSMHGGAHSLLFELVGHAYVRAERLAGLDMYGDFEPGHPRHKYDLISLTIDGANTALSPENTQALVRVLQMSRKVGIKVRLTVPEVHWLQHPVIRGVMATADQTECSYDHAKKEFVTS